MLIMTVNVPRNSKDSKILASAQLVGRAGRVSGIYRNSLKRVFESTLIICSSVIAVPLVAILAVLVALDGHSPLYHQDRVGMGGRVFRMWKLRTMVPNADQKLEQYLSQNAEARAEWDTTQKLKSDPRITKLGRILRKCSLDELPQFWNVLIGDMSLVGPRPMMVCQKDMYPGSAYYHLRPGITGFWQVSERNDSEFKSRAAFDSRYDQAISFSTDIGIILRTFTAVFRGTGY
jgi:exopolysaccharide production protein ExoY